MKRTAGCTDNQGSWPWADWQCIKCTITEAICYSSDLSRGGLEVPCTLHFSGDAKLGRSYKLNASKILILIGFNLMQASTVNLSNLILHQFFLLYGMYN